MKTARVRRLSACRSFVFAASLAAFSLSHAQSTAPNSSAPADEILTLSKFEVVTTQNKGYVTTNAATGFKTNQELIKIPQAITVVTRDLIDDIGYSNSSDVLQFSGASNFYRGEALAIRGSRVNNSLVDELPDNTPYMDNVFVDSYEVIRGPASVLYVNASIGGVVLKTSRKPLPFTANSITLKLDEHGRYRTEIDSNGPVANVGEGKLRYRVAMAFQDGDTAFKNEDDQRVAVHPSFAFTYKDTTVRLGIDLQRLKHAPAGNAIVTPEGKLYTGAGRDEAYWAPDMSEDFRYTALRLQLLHRFSPNWEMKAQAAKVKFSRLGGIVFPAGGVDWVTKTVRFTARRNDQKYDNYYLQADVNGKYDIGRLKNQSTFGFTLADETAVSQFWSSPTFGTVVRPLDNPDMNSIRVPQAEEYTPPANPGARTKVIRSNTYFQQTIDVIPDRLSLVGGVSYTALENNANANIAIRPATTTVTTLSETLHRYGAVLNITKEVALYALESTTVLPPGTGRLQNGGFLPPQEGEGRELGVKTSFFDGRISSTFSVFKIELTNQAVFAGIDASGISYFVPIGSTTQEGWDADLAVKPLVNWQIVGTFFDGKVEDQNGGPVANTYKQMFSVFTRYDFLNGLKGLSIGGGVTRISGRLLNNQGVIFPPGQSKPFIELEPGTLVNAFVSYKHGKHWTFRAAVDNLLDEAYAVGAQGPNFVDPSPPRTLSLAATYKF